MSTKINDSIIAVSHATGTTVNGIVIGTAPRQLTSYEWLKLSISDLITAGCRCTTVANGTPVVIDSSKSTSASVLVKNAELIEYLNDVSTADLSTKISTSEKGAINGVVPLDASGKIALQYAPVNLLGAMKIQGVWNATSDTITALVNAQEASVAGSSKGMYWVVGTAGSTSMSGETDWKTKDWCVWNGTAWEKVDNTDQVTSVAGRTGLVTLTKTDVGLANVDNTSDANKPVSTAQQTALNLKANIASPTFTGTVGGITKAMVGLGNVDNTTDVSKPISTATQTALDLKADVLTTYNKTTIDSAFANHYNKSEINTSLGSKVDIAGDTMTGKLITKAGDATGAGLNIPKASATFTPADGDIWYTTSNNLAYHLGGSTYHIPLSNGGGSRDLNVNSMSVESASPFYTLNGTSGQNKGIKFQTGGLNRWLNYTDPSEAFILQAYDAAGTSIGQVFNIANGANGAFNIYRPIGGTSLTLSDNINLNKSLSYAEMPSKIWRIDMGTSTSASVDDGKAISWTNYIAGTNATGFEYYWGSISRAGAGATSLITRMKMNNSGLEVYGNLTSSQSDNVLNIDKGALSLRRGDSSGVGITIGSTGDGANGVKALTIWSSTQTLAKINADKTAEFFGTVYAPLGNSTEWNTAYGWGNHAGAGYLTSSSLSSYALLTSPTFVGNPSAPTQAQGDNSTRIATTGFVKTELSTYEKKDIVYRPASSTTAAMDLATTQQLDFTTALTAATTITVSNPVVGAVNLITGQQFTSAVAITIAMAGVSFYQIGTNSGNVGSIVLPATSFYVSNRFEIQLDWKTSNVCYVTVTGKDGSQLAPLGSPALTGNPTSVTPAVGDNDTSIATSAFVQAAIGNMVTKSATATLTATEALAPTIKWTGAAGTLTMPTTSRGYLIVNNGTGIVTVRAVTAATSVVDVPIGYTYYVFVLDASNVKLNGTNWANLAGVPTNVANALPTTGGVMTGSIVMPPAIDVKYGTVAGGDYIGQYYDTASDELKFYNGTGGANLLILNRGTGSLVTTGSMQAGTVIQANGGGQCVQLLPGVTDHCYMAFYARTASPGSRSGYIGYPAAASNNLAYDNALGGHYFNQAIIGASTIQATGFKTASGTGTKVFADNGTLVGVGNEALITTYTLGEIALTSRTNETEVIMFTVPANTLVNSKMVTARIRGYYMNMSPGAVITIRLRETNSTGGIVRSWTSSRQTVGSVLTDFMFKMTANGQNTHATVTPESSNWTNDWQIGAEGTSQFDHTVARTYSITIQNSVTHSQVGITYNGARVWMEQ